MPHFSNAGIWGDLERGGVRFLALEGARSLFIERADATRPISAETARTMHTLGTHASGEAVWLLDHDDQVELLVDVSRASNVSIKDFSTVRTVGLSPKLSNRLLRWAVQRPLQDGLCLVDIQPDTSVHDESFEFLIHQILEPWIARRRHTPADSWPARHDFETHWLETVEQMNKASGDLALSAARGLQSVLVQLKHSRSDAGTKLFLDEGFQKGRVLEEKLRVLVEGDSEVLFLHAYSDIDVVPGSHAVASRITALRDAKKALDSLHDFILREEGKIAAVGEVKSPRKHEHASADPVDNAIAIRKRLQSTVNLLDASKWAQWRGIKSQNPSAALGKYKQKRRLFAVQSGNRDLYPAFQFSDNAEPLPIVEEILKLVPEEAQGWPLLSWFEAGNVLLKGRKPSDVLSSDAQAVREAAAHFYSRED